MQQWPWGPMGQQYVHIQKRLRSLSKKLRKAFQNEKYTFFSSIQKCRVKLLQFKKDSTFYSN